MIKAEKEYLRWKVKAFLSEGKPDQEIVQRLIKLGFTKSTIKKYIKVFKGIDFETWKTK